MGQLEIEKQDKINTLLDPTKLYEFWAFVNERQNVWIKRVVQNKPAPWSDDPILQTVFFTNVYRELDKGTIFLKDRVLNRGNPVDELFEILLYRQFNNIETYEVLDSGLREYGSWSNWETLSACLKNYAQVSGNSLFTDAFMITGNKWGGFENKRDNICWLMFQIWKERHTIHRNWEEAKSLEDLWRYISSLPGYGPFLAYEVVTDIGYSKRLHKFEEDDFVNAGPGCRRGLDIIFPESKDAKVKYSDLIQFLRQNQRDYFNILDISFPYLNGKELTLRNVEHSLCEYYKYWRAKHTGKIRRRYAAF